MAVAMPAVTGASPAARGANRMNVDDVMTREVQTCPWGASLNEAARLMWDHDFGVLPITDGEGTVVGILTDRDLCMAAYTQGRALPQISVATAMSRAVHSCKRHDSVAEAMATMKAHQVRRLPVLDDEGHIEGLLSLSDLTRALYGKPRPKAKHLSPEHISETLAALSAPRRGGNPNKTVIEVSTPAKEADVLMPKAKIKATTSRGSNR
jgi:CBS-domain-containing membrane protein